MSHVKQGVLKVILWLNGNEKPKETKQNGKRHKYNQTSVANPADSILLLLSLN